MNDQQFMERLQQLKKTNNYTIYELSKITDIPFSTLYSMEHNDTMPSIHTFLSLCEGFHITPCEFFFQNNDTVLNVSSELHDLVSDAILLSPKNRLLIHEIIKVFLKSQKGKQEPKT